MPSFSSGEEGEQQKTKHGFRRRLVRAHGRFDRFRRRIGGIFSMGKCFTYGHRHARGAVEGITTHTTRCKIVGGSLTTDPIHADTEVEAKWLEAWRTSVECIGRLKVDFAERARMVETMAGQATFA